MKSWSVGFLHVYFPQLFRIVGLKCLRMAEITTLWQQDYGQGDLSCIAQGSTKCYSMFGGTILIIVQNYKYL